MVGEQKDQLADLIEIFIVFPIKQFYFCKPSVAQMVYNCVDSSSMKVKGSVSKFFYYLEKPKDIFVSKKT